MNRKMIKKIWNSILVKQKITLFLLFFATIFMSVGYASINDVIISLSGHGNVKAVEASNTGLIITDAVYSSDNNADDEHSTMDYNGLFLDSSIILGITSESNITYQVTVQNNTSDTYKYNGLLYDETDSNFYSNSNIEVVSNHIGDYLSPGNSMTILVTYQYKSGYTPSSAETLDSYVKLDFEERYVARIASTYYDTLQDAVDAASTNGTKTEIVLLKSIDNENISIAANKNIEFDLQNFTISDDGLTSDNLIYNEGILTVKNGTIIRRTTFTGANKANEVMAIQNGSTSSRAAVLNITGGVVKNDVYQAVKNYGTLNITGGVVECLAAQGTINNEAGATSYISGGRIIGHERQALFNDNGTVTISNNAYFESEITEVDPSKPSRGTVENTKLGTIHITGGTIISNSDSTTKPALLNSSTLTIGSDDGTVSVSVPTIQGKSYGIISSSNFYFYDGIVKGVTDTFNLTDGATIIPASGYMFTSSYETISGDSYKTEYLVRDNTVKLVTFDYHGGVVTEGTRSVVENTPIGTLPTATRPGHTFDGWFTEETNGTQIDDTEVITADVTFHAHWTLHSYAKIGDSYYDNAQQALSHVPTNGTSTTIEILQDHVSTKLTISATKNVVLDLNGHTLSFTANNQNIETNGVLEIKNGTLYGNNNQGIVNVQSGTTTINNVNISQNNAGQKKQAVYVTGGTVTIKGNTSLVSSAKESYNNKYRGTLQIDAGTAIVESGTIENLVGPAITNYGTLILGEEDGTIDSTSPEIIANTYGLQIGSGGVSNFYDGILKGKTAALSGTISDYEDGASPVTGTDGAYNTLHYELPTPQQQNSPLNSPLQIQQINNNVNETELSNTTTETNDTSETE